MESLVNFLLTDQNGIGGASIGIGYVSHKYVHTRLNCECHFISKAVTGSVLWILLSQLANPVSLSDSQKRNEASFVPVTDDKVFDGGMTGKDINLSEVLAGLLTRNGVLMQILINAVLVRAGSRGM